VKRVDVVTHDGFPQLAHVVLHRADGPSGIGESHGHATATAELLLELAQQFVGAPLSPARAATLGQTGPYGTRRADTVVSVESRAASALEMAAWDLLGNALEVPLAFALGGARAERVPVYATAVGADHVAALQDPRRVASALAGHGFSLVKLAPFTRDGAFSAELARVEEAVSTGVRIAVDLVGQFDRATAARRCARLDAVGLAWIEDPVADSLLGPLPSFLRRLDTPVCVGERCAGIHAYDRLIRDEAVGLVHLDVAWCGGLSVARTVGEVAAAHAVPVALHNDMGPVAWATSLHLAQHLGRSTLVECPSAGILETYPSIVASLPAIADGRSTPAGPGHGCTLSPSYLARARVRSVGAR